MLFEADASHFALMLSGRAPEPLTLVGDSAIAPPEVMAMLAELAASIRAGFAPSAWMIVEAGEIVGLLSAVRPPADGELAIGYGVAPSRQRRGAASRAVADILRWAESEPRVRRVTAETSTANLPSQRTLERNGFQITGTREDPEDGPLVCWERQTGEP